jgi:hypothetical protein
MVVISAITARGLEKRLGIDLSTYKIPLAEFRKGIAEELEHIPTLRRIQQLNSKCKISSADVKFISASIAFDHLKSITDYYTRLARMEKEAKLELAKLELTKSLRS